MRAITGVLNFPETVTHVKSRKKADPFIAEKTLNVVGEVEVKAPRETQTRETHIRETHVTFRPVVVNQESSSTLMADDELHYSSRRQANQVKIAIETREKTPKVMISALPKRHPKTSTLFNLKAVDPFRQLKKSPYL